MLSSMEYEYLMQRPSIFVFCVASTSEKDGRWNGTAWTIASNQMLFFCRWNVLWSAHALKNIAIKQKNVAHNWVKEWEPKLWNIYTNQDYRGCCCCFHLWNFWYFANSLILYTLNLKWILNQMKFNFMLLKWKDNLFLATDWLRRIDFSLCLLHIFFVASYDR